MVDPKVMPVNATGSNCFKEAVCIDAGRVYDSCSDKDCLEDLQVMFTDCTQPYIDQAVSVKIKSAEVLNVYIDVEPVPFNRGFYSVDMTFFFHIKLSVYTSNACQPTTVCGLATFTKKVILYGSEGNVKVFRSCDPFENENAASAMPNANVQVVDPVALNCRLVECARTCECPVNIPPCVCSCYEGEFCGLPTTKGVYVTLGLFTIVQLERQVQMLVPAYDFCIPDKECVTTTDDPCELFRKIKFPTNEFFPPRMSDLEEDNVSRPCK